MVAPVVLHGRAWGELYVARGVGEPVFERGEAEFATVLAAVIAAGVVQSEQLAEVRRLACTDPLTGLANRRAVDARLGAQQNARYANAADPDGGQTVQASPRVSLLDTRTYTRTLVLPADV